MFTMRPVILDAEATAALMREKPTKKNLNQKLPFMVLDRGEVYTTGEGTYIKEGSEDEAWVKKKLCDPKTKPIRIMKCVIVVNSDSCPEKRRAAWSKNFDKPKNIFIDIDHNTAYVANGNWLLHVDWDVNQITNIIKAKKALKDDWAGLFAEI